MSGGEPAAPLRVGITLPQFRDDAETAIATARLAEEVGIDGVFVFDHLWPLGRADRPILSSQAVLGALAAETRRLTIGTLVTRVGVLPPPVLTNALTSLRRMLDGRLVVTLGTGDSGNRAENEGYGVPFGTVAERVAQLITACRDLRAAGVRTWVGGRSRAVRRAAAEEADGWNCWGWCADVATFATAASGIREVAPASELSWAAQVVMGRTDDEVRAKLARYGERDELVSGTVDDLGTRFRALAAAGASWVVCAPLDVGSDREAVRLVAEAATAARYPRG